VTSGQDAAPARTFARDLAAKNAHWELGVFLTDAAAIGIYGSRIEMSNAIAAIVCSGMLKVDPVPLRIERFESVLRKPKDRLLCEH
jgi:hypothetical protein